MVMVPVLAAAFTKLDRLVMLPPEVSIVLLLVTLMTMPLEMVQMAEDLSMPPPKLMTGLPVVPVEIVMPPEPSDSVPAKRLMIGSAVEEERESEMPLAAIVPLELSARTEPVLKTYTPLPE